MHQTSNTIHQTLYITHCTSNIIHQTSDIKHHTSYIEHQISYIICHNSYFFHLMLIRYTFEWSGLDPQRTRGLALKMSCSRTIFGAHASWFELTCFDDQQSRVCYSIDHLCTVQARDHSPDHNCLRCTWSLRQIGCMPGNEVDTLQAQKSITTIIQKIPVCCP